jgi:uncharacterized protein YkwD
MQTTSLHAAVIGAVLALGSLPGCSLDESPDDETFDEVESAVVGTYADADADAHAARFNPHRRNHVNRAALARRSCLDDLARRRARKMADGQCPGSDAICHFGGLGNAITSACSFGWSSAGENVGVGSTENGLWQAFLGSAPHHANIDSASFDRLGVGAFRRASDNALFIVHVFANAN